MMNLRGFLFDKDGTLFDFQKTWAPFAARMIHAEAAGDAQVAGQIAEILGFDLEATQFHRHSIVIAGTNGEVAAAMASIRPGADPEKIIERLNEGAAHVPQVPVTDLVALFDDLRGRDLRLGIATNDAEAPARANLTGAGVIEQFDFVSGYDSGYGSKPEPGPLLAFAEAMALPPHEIAMVGDSTHDLRAGAAAGMFRVGVLTGPAGRADLEPEADVVLNHIGELPGWLDAAVQA